MPVGRNLPSEQGAGSRKGQRMDGPHGLLVIDKPAGWTSREAVNHVQRWFPRRTRVGHSGTLDPLATGVLVVCVGRATRLADYIQAQSKTYRTTIHLGATSTTDDADGVITPCPPARPPTPEQLATVLRQFEGTIQQMPPAYSALKVGGRRAHELAREGEAVSLTPRTVHVAAIRLLRYAWPEVELEVDCGKGTYIRSLARDIGAALGCGGYVAALRRLRVGEFRAEQALPLPAEGPPPLLPPQRAVAHLPLAVVGAAEGVRFRHGQAVAATWPHGLVPPEGSEAAVCDAAGMFLGVGRWLAGRIRPQVVFAA